MKYYLDCEFDGYRGSLLSLALVREDGESLYLINDIEPMISGFEPTSIRSCTCARRSRLSPTTKRSLPDTSRAS